MVLLTAVPHSGFDPWRFYKHRDAIFHTGAPSDYLWQINRASLLSRLLPIIIALDIRLTILLLRASLPIRRRATPTLFCEDFSKLFFFCCCCCLIFGQRERERVRVRRNPGERTNMKDRSNKLFQLLFGSLACLALTSIVNADGKLIYILTYRVFRISTFTPSISTLLIALFSFPSVKLSIYNTFSYY